MKGLGRRAEGGEGTSLVKDIPGRGSSWFKALGQEGTRYMTATARRPVWLRQRRRGEELYYVIHGKTGKDQIRKACLALEGNLNFVLRGMELFSN